jgi:hypothetical protein
MSKKRLESFAKSRVIVVCILYHRTHHYYKETQSRPPYRGDGEQPQPDSFPEASAGMRSTRRSMYVYRCPHRAPTTYFTSGNRGQSSNRPQKQKPTRRSARLNPESTKRFEHQCLAKTIVVRHPSGNRVTLSA